MSAWLPGCCTVVIVHREPVIAAGVAHWLGRMLDGPVHVLARLDAGEAADIVIADHDTALRLAATMHTPPARVKQRLLAITDERREHEVRRALEAGVDGYLLSDCDEHEFLRCLQALRAGGRYVGMAVALALANSLGREALTAREQDVLALLARGHGNPAIAAQLGIALGTAKSHVKALIAKLGAHSRTEVVAVAVARGLVDATGVKPAPAAVIRSSAGARKAATTTPP